MARVKLKKGTTMRMFCWGCMEETLFEVVDPAEGPVCECGHWQDSEAQGAAEICDTATFHDLDEYKRLAAIAKIGGYYVPDFPIYFRPLVDLTAGPTIEDFCN